MRQNIPDVLSNEDATRLQDSFHVQPTDQVSCAASARLWEELLEHYRLPFLLLRVADLRYTTRGPGCQMPALHLYIEVSFTIIDATHVVLQIALAQEYDS